MIKNFDELLKTVQNSPKVKVAVAAAEDMDVITVSTRCAELADFILIGEAQKIEMLYKEAGKKIPGNY